MAAVATDAGTAVGERVVGTQSFIQSSLENSHSQVTSETTPLLSTERLDKRSTNMAHSDSKVSVLVYVLVIVFAWASWIDINGLWVEIPLLVNTLPERWNLPSYLVIIIQVANVGPLIYTLANRLAPKHIKEWTAVYVILAIGASACILLTFFWDHTTKILGEMHSTALIGLTTFLALVDCTSSVVFLPYMAYFKPQYMTAFYLGEGLSGLLPGLMGLAQGVGSDPTCVNETVIVYNETTLINVTEHQVTPVYPPERFGISAFFAFLFTMVVLSGFAFTLLHFLPYCQREKVPQYPVYFVEVTLKDDSQDVSRTSSRRSSEQYKELPDHPEVLDMVPSSDDLLKDTDRSSTASPSSVSVGWSLSPTQFAFLLFLTAWSNALLNGILPSTQSYSCIPYGNLAYTLAVRLSTIANPLVCFLALFIRTRSLQVVGTLTLIATMLGCYQLYLAAMSPHPPLQDKPVGVFLVVITQVMLTACISYVKVTSASLLNDHGRQRALRWCGIVTQLGSCLGAVATFLAVNVFTALESEPPCQ